MFSPTMYVIKKLKILLQNMDELEGQGKRYLLGIAFYPLFPSPHLRQSKCPIFSDPSSHRLPNLLSWSFPELICAKGAFINDVTQIWALSLLLSYNFTLCNNCVTSLWMFPQYLHPTEFVKICHIGFWQLLMKLLTPVAEFGMSHCVLNNEKIL